MPACTGRFVAIEVLNVVTVSPWCGAMVVSCSKSSDGLVGWLVGCLLLLSFVVCVCAVCLLCYLSSIILSSDQSNCSFKTCYLRVVDNDSDVENIITI